jgi:hypothetical protein
MNWTSFSWGALASLAMFLIVELVRLLHRIPFDKHNEGADQRFFSLHGHYSELRVAVENLREAQRAYFQEGGGDHRWHAVVTATGQVDAVLSKQEA